MFSVALGFGLASGTPCLPYKSSLTEAWQSRTTAFPMSISGSLLQELRVSLKTQWHAYLQLADGSSGLQFPPPPAHSPVLLGWNPVWRHDTFPLRKEGGSRRLSHHRRSDPQHSKIRRLRRLQSHCGSRECNVFTNPASGVLPTVCSGGAFRSSLCIRRIM